MSQDIESDVYCTCDCSYYIISHYFIDTSNHYVQDIKILDIINPC